MNRLRIFYIVVFCCVSQTSLSQSPNPALVLNEVSQGVQGEQEYIELIVFGNAGCNGYVPTLDIREFVIDDNNGEYLVPSNPGANISDGAIRFSDNSLWGAIPQGTIIVIYNENDRNPAIPPDDISITDGNNRLILPANSYLLQGQGISPSASSTDPSNYSASAGGPWINGGGLWAYVHMEDSGDTFRANYFLNLGVLGFQAVCWGTNIGNPQVSDRYFPGSAAGLVFYSDVNLGTSGFVSGPATTSQTPGYPNSPANAQYIQISGSIDPSLHLALTIAPESCFNVCDAGITAEVTGGIAPYTYSWNGVSTGDMNTIQNQCSGTYNLVVTDANGCIIDSSFTFTTQELVYSIVHTDETCAGACDGTASVTISGGTGAVSIHWEQGDTVTELAGLCSNYYMATLQDENGCTAQLEVDIAPSQPSTGSVFTTTGPFIETDPPVQLENSTPGGTYTTTGCSDCLTLSGIFDPSVAGVGIYEICYTPPGNCANTNCATFIVNPCTVQQTEEIIRICEGDSVLIFGNWQSQPDLFSHTFEGAHCDSIHEIKLLFYDTPDLHTSISVCKGDSVNLFGNWIDTNFTLSQPATSPEGCSLTNYFHVIETLCPEEAIIYIPNTFTPNGDETNDVFRIELMEGTVEEGFIFNRWGEIIARFDSETLTWNGNNGDGDPAPDGVYTYVIRYAPTHGVVDQITGHVTLLR